MNNWTKEEVNEAVNKVTEKAAKDAPYRELCKSDIHAAIKEVTGKEIPPKFSINVIDNTGYHLSVLLLPLKQTDGELSESELESVAGGSKDAFNDLFKVYTGDEAKEQMEKYGYM